MRRLAAKIRRVSRTYTRSGPEMRGQRPHHHKRCAAQPGGIGAVRLHGLRSLPLPAAPAQHREASQSREQQHGFMADAISPRER